MTLSWLVISMGFIDWFRGDPKKRLMAAKTYLERIKGWAKINDLKQALNYAEMAKREIKVSGDRILLQGIEHVIGYITRGEMKRLELGLNDLIESIDKRLQ